MPWALSYRVEVRLLEEGSPPTGLPLHLSGRNGHLSPSAFKQLPISVCVVPQYSFISLVLGGESVDKPFFINNPNDVTRILFNIQGAHLSYPMSLWEASKRKRNVELCVQ